MSCLRQVSTTQNSITWSQHEWCAERSDTEHFKRSVCERLACKAPQTRELQLSRTPRRDKKKKGWNQMKHIIQLIAHRCLCLIVQSEGNQDYKRLNWFTSSLGGTEGSLVHARVGLSHRDWVETTWANYQPVGPRRTAQGWPHIDALSWPKDRVQ